MKRSIFTIVIMALVIGFTSNSFAASDRAIEKKVFEVVVEMCKDLDLTDIVKSKSSVNIIIHTQKGDIHWIAADVSIQSKEWGHYVLATYITLVESGFSLKHSTNKGFLASVNNDESMKKYRNYLAEAKVLAEHYGDTSQFVFLTLN